MSTKKFIKRDLLYDLKHHLRKKEITFIVGPRQVGKTTLMNMLKQHVENQGRKTVFLTLDFESDKKYFTSQDTLIEKLHLELGEKKAYVFLDEIQRKQDAGIFLKGIYDKNLPYKFIVSGSGSVELKEKVHESLAGRKLLFELHPVSFNEFINFKTAYRYEEKLHTFFSLEAIKRDALFHEYLNFGGYPRVILETTTREKAMIIDEIYQSYLEKDVSYLLRLEKPDVFSSLIKVLAGQIGNIVNYSEIANTLGVSLPTVKNYLWYLEKTFIIKKITPYFRNIRKEITKSPIFYFYDLGLRNYVLGIFGQVARSDDFGFLFQNFIFNILKVNMRFSGATLHFWRTKEKAEVDFIIRRGRETIPIEVKYTKLKRPVVERSLRSFITKYHPQKALVVTRGFKEKVIINKTTVYFVPFWDNLISYLE